MTTHQKDIQALATEILELSKTHPKAAYTSFDSPLVLKAKELIAAVEQPRDYVTSVMQSMLDSSAMRTLLSLGAIQAIPAKGSINLADLEAGTGAQASLLKRLFRALVTSGKVTLHPDGTYSHTPFSAAFAENEGDVASMFAYLFDETAVLARLPEYFKQRGAKEPDGDLATTHNPRTWYAGQEGKTAFEILEQDPESLEAFQKMMTMAVKWRPFTGFYDFGKLQTEEEGRAVLVDVGGADGTTVAKVLEAHPEIKPQQCVVQDMESAIERTGNNPDLPKSVQLQSHDFFQAQPVKGARGYFVRAICHDWSDTMVIKILSNLAAAASQDSKILIGDVVFPDGPAPTMATVMDMYMMCIGGKERTRSDFEKVLDAAGLKLDGVYSSGYDSGFSIVEASLK